MVEEIQAVSARITLVLMILFLALGTLAIFDPLRRQEKNEEKKDRDSHVVWLKGEKLEEITISGKTPPVRLQCAHAGGCAFDGTGDWKLLAPVSDKADPSAVGTLASTLLNLTHNSRIAFDSPPDPQEFGLDQPQAAVALKVAGRKDPVVLSFGKASALGPSVYLGVSGDPGHLFLVPNYLPQMVNKELFHWRSKRLFPEVESTAITKLGWKSGKLEARAFRVKDRGRRVRPAPVLASKCLIEGLGSTLAYAAAKGIFAPSRGSPEAKKALSGKPELEIEFAAAGTAHKLVLFTKPGAKPGGRRELLAVADREGPVYLVDPAAFDRFTKDLSEYRQRTLIDEEIRAKIDEARFTFPRDRQEIILKLEGRDWAPASGAEPMGALSQERVNAFLDGLRDNDYKAFFPLKGASPEARAYRTGTADTYVELKSAGKLLAQASFHVYERKKALTESEGDVRVLGEDFLRQLPARLGDLSQPANQTVVVQPEKGTADGNGSQPAHAPR
jgi:hypothetical protein